MDLVPVAETNSGLVPPAARDARSRGARGRRPATAPARSRPAAAVRPGSPASAASIPASPQPRTLAASAASRPSSAAFSAARAVPRAPLFPSRLGRGHHRRLRPAPPGAAWQIASFTSVTCLDQAPEPLILRDFAAGPLSSSGPGSQVHRPRPPFHLPRQVPLRPVTGMARAGARCSPACRTYGAPRSATPAGSPRPGPSSAVQLLAPALESRQLITLPPARRLLNPECLTTLRVGSQPATIQNRLRI